MSRCRCDKFEHPSKLNIAAGLSSIPRQIAGFPEFRRAMLAVIRQYPALYHWIARGDDDFGIMLLEMWAYVSDVQSFYDEVIAHEAYMRTARLRPSLRKLVNLLGYVPRPAVAASVSLTTLAEGRKPVVLPEELAFRSSAFDDEAPQVFELDAETTIHPLNNQWSLYAPQQDTLSSTGSTAVETFDKLLFTTDTPLKKDDLALIRVGSTDALNQTGTIANIVDTEGEDGKKYKQMDFSPALSLLGNTSPADVQISRATQKGSLWKIVVSGNPSVISSTNIILDGLYRNITAGQYIILGKEDKHRWFEVKENKEIMITVSPATTTTVKDSDNNDVTVAVPALTVLTTQLVLDISVNDSSRKGTDSDWDDSHTTKIILYYGLVSGGTVTTTDKTTIAIADKLVVSGRIEESEDATAPGKFLVEDNNENGYEVGGTLNYSTGEFTINQGEGWDTPLAMPVTFYGNVVTASRGETVESEVLGSGDASLANQFFVLKKSPLTYTSSPTSDNEQGVASTLKVYVNGLLWNEAPSFYGAGDEYQIYIVRQNDEGESIVTFGDGRRGARPLTGVDNIVATYRHGAGKAAPPAGAITQLVKPVKGLKSVKSPIAAIEGDDAESSDGLRNYATKSALLLGRAVSIDDMEAVAAGASGVRAVTAEWRWNGIKQRPVIQLWYLGDENIKKDVGQNLRRLSDPTTPIAVDVAIPIPITMSIDVEIDEMYMEDDVLNKISTALMDSETGLLSPERIGIGKPLFRSRVFEAVMSVEGTLSVRDIIFKFLWFQWSWTTHAIKSPAGTYLDFEKGGLLLNK